jgi:hypothetical protein
VARLLLAAVCCYLIAATAAPQAQALVGSCGLQVCIPISRYDDVTAFAARNGATDVSGIAHDASGLPSCDNVCNDLYLGEHRPMPGQVSSDAMHAELGRLEMRTGMWPSLAKGIGTAAAVVDTFAAGMVIGDGLNRKFLHIGIPGVSREPDPDANPEGLQWEGLDAEGHGEPLSWVGFGPTGGSGHTYIPLPMAVDGGWTPDEDIIVLAALSRTGDLSKYEQVLSGNDSDLGNCFQRPMIPHTGGNIVEAASFDKGGCGYIGDDGHFHSVPSQVVVYFRPTTRLLTDAPKDYDVNEDGAPDFSVDDWPGKPSDAADLKSRVVSELQDHPEKYPNLRTYINETIENPPGKMEMPDCHGLTVPQCVALLEEAGFQGTHHTITVDPGDAWVSLKPRTIIDTDPRKGTRVDVEEGDIYIRRNPADVDMPVRVPHIDPGTPREDVEKALGDVDLEPVFSVRPEPDTRYGPNEVTETPVEPQPGSIQPRGTPIEVEVNGADAPVPPGSTGGGGGIDLSPLSALTPCERFPFGVPCWVNDALGGWSGSGQAPVFDFPMPIGDDLHVDLSVAEPLLTPIRPLLLLSSMLGLGWFFMRLTGGFGGGSAKDDD